MSHYKISNRYAQALLNLSIENNLLDKVTEDVTLLNEFIDASRDLNLLFKSPIVKVDKKLKIFEVLFKDKFSKLFYQFCILVIKKNREALIKEILQEFYNLRNSYLGIININVKTAFKFDDEQISRLKSNLEQLTKKKVNLIIEVDSSLKGGFTVQIEDTVYDASIRRQLEILHHKFLYGESN